MRRTGGEGGTRTPYRPIIQTVANPGQTGHPRGAEFFSKRRIVAEIDYHRVKTPLEPAIEGVQVTPVQPRSRPTVPAVELLRKVTVPISSLELHDDMVCACSPSIPWFGAQPLQVLAYATSAIFKARAALLLENLAFRHQLGVLRRSVRRPKLTAADRPSFSETRSPAVAATRCDGNPIRRSKVLRSSLLGIVNTRSRRGSTESVQKPNTRPTLNPYTAQVIRMEVPVQAARRS